MSSSTHPAWFVGPFRALSGAIVAACLFLSPALGQSTGTGTISGTVFNTTTQKMLERAAVTVAGTNLSAQTLSDGTFRLYNVPAGDHELVVSYAGLDDAKVPVKVAGGETATVEVPLKSAIYELDAFKVSAEP